MIPLCAILLFLLTTRGLYPAWGKSARVAIFETVSALTTTGFSTVGSAILAAYGYGLKESLFEYASAVSNSGLSLGLTSPSAPAGALWAMTVGMFLGRLEFFVILASAAKLLRDAFAMCRAR